MGSAILYFAIVVMWLSVLLPMWLRRDRDADDFSELPETEPGDQSGTGAEAVPDAEAVSDAADPDTTDLGALAAQTSDAGSTVDADADADTVVQAPAAERSSTVPTRVRPSPGRRRARIIARRRRRLLWSVLLVIASAVTAAVRVMPWWAMAPSVAWLVGYLVVLRTAVQVDQEQRDRAARLRAERLRRQRAHRKALAAALAREAEIIEFRARTRSQVFDQYADGRRAVGD